MTHYLPFFTERHGYQQRAACGTWILFSEHSTTPSCLGCQRWLRQDAEETAALMGRDIQQPLEDKDETRAEHRRRLP